MQCYEYELIRVTLMGYVREIDPGCRVDALAIADYLDTYGITSITRLADLKSIARNICAQRRLAA